MRTKCQVTAEYHSGSGHHGRSKTVKVELDWQPPGHGSFTIPIEIAVCEGHRWLLGSHLNAFLVEGDFRREPEHRPLRLPEPTKERTTGYRG